MIFIYLFIYLFIHFERDTESLWYKCKDIKNNMLHSTNKIYNNYKCKILQCEFLTVKEEEWQEITAENGG